MEYQATSGDGSQTTRLPSASLEKAFSTCHHRPSSNIPNLRTDSIQASGLERTHQENPMLRLEARSSKQELSGDKSNHGNTIETDGRHQWCTMGTESITLQSTFHLAKHDISTKAEEKGITTQEEKTPAIEDQQPMDEEAPSPKKQKVTITEETPAHPITVPTSLHHQ